MMIENYIFNGEFLFFGLIILGSVVAYRLGLLDKAIAKVARDKADVVPVSKVTMLLGLEVVKADLENLGLENSVRAIDLYEYKLMAGESAYQKALSDNTEQKEKRDHMSKDKEWLLHNAWDYVSAMEYGRGANHTAYSDQIDEWWNESRTEKEIIVFKEELFGGF